MKQLLLIVIFSLSFLSAGSDAEKMSVSVGITETMGIFGMINLNYNIDSWSNETNRYFITTGVFPIPFIGGAGIGWKRYFNSSRFSPYVSATALGTYVLGFCQTDNCDSSAKLGAIISTSLGCDMQLIKSNKFNLHLQVGVLSQYNLTNLEVFESPSDEPGLWPVFNFKFYR